MSKNILLLGATGTAGSALAQKLISDTDYITTIPSLVELAVQLISDENMYLRESVSITRKA